MVPGGHSAALLGQPTRQHRGQSDSDTWIDMTNMFKDDIKQLINIDCVARPGMPRAASAGWVANPGRGGATDPAAGVAARLQAAPAWKRLPAHGYRYPTGNLGRQKQ